MQVTLKAARINAGLSQTEAAKSIGVTRTTVGNWERGKSFPNVAQVKRLEDAYHVAYDDILFLPEDTLKA